MYIKANSSHTWGKINILLLGYEEFLRLLGCRENPELSSATARI
jgi:hypothetical protein